MIKYMADPTTPPDTPAKDSLDPIIKLLFVGMIFFTFVVIACAHFFPDDGQVFQVFSSLLGGFGGSLWTRISPSKKPQEPTK